MTERDQLLLELASLEAELLSLTDSRPAKRPRVAEQQHAEPSGDGDALADSLLALLQENDSALSTGRNAGAGKGAEREGTSEELESERELARINVQFTGVVFSTTSDRVVESGTAHQTREHTLAGQVPSPTPSLTLGFRVLLTVREPALILPAGPSTRSTRDPGAEYQVRTMAVQVWGGGSELAAIIEALDLGAAPDPPAFFGALRQFSLHATERARVLDALRGRLARWTVERDEDAKGKRPAEGDDDDALDSRLVFRNAARTLMLTLDYSLDPIPRISLVPALADGLELGDDARRVIGEIPVRFEEMLREGFGVEESVSALVEGVLGA